MKESANRHLIFVVMACVILGFVVSRQFYWQKEVERVTKPTIEEDMALQVNQLYTSNKKLRKESAKLQLEYNNLKLAVDNKDLARSALQKSLTEFQIVTGEVAVNGPGVIINFDEDLPTIQITDLVNALRNIGAEVIAINNKRISPYFSWNDTTFTPPLTIKAIGDKTVLKDSLERPGGIIEIIGSGNVIIYDNIEIPAKL